MSGNWFTYKDQKLYVQDLVILVKMDLKFQLQMN